MFQGGRGKEPPYGKTVIMRIPGGIKLQIEAIVETFKELVLQNRKEELQQLLKSLESIVVATTYKSDTKALSYEEAKEVARKLINQKKSKEVTIEKLLRVLYSVDSSSGDEVQ